MNSRPGKYCLIPSSQKNQLRPEMKRNFPRTTQLLGVELRCKPRSLLQGCPRSSSCIYHLSKGQTLQDFHLVPRYTAVTRSEQPHTTLRENRNLSSSSSCLLNLSPGTVSNHQPQRLCRAILLPRDQLADFPWSFQANFLQTPSGNCTDGPFINECEQPPTG